MYYEINVAKKDKKGDYRHYFATAERSIDSKEELIEMTKHFMTVFPAPEYHITVSYRPQIVYDMEAEDFINAPDKLTDK